MDEVLAPEESKGNGYSSALALNKQDQQAYQAAPKSAWSLSHLIPLSLDEAKIPSAHQAIPEVDTPKKVFYPSS